MSDEVAKGLDGVVVAESALSYIDGESGDLRYRGYSIKELAEHASFEEVLYLLWEGELPDRTALAEFSEQVRADRSIPPAVVETLKSLASAGAHPMVALRTAVSELGTYDPDRDAAADDLDATRRMGCRIVSKMPTILAAYDRARQGESIIEPDPELGLAANFLYMLTGVEPDPLEAETFDQAMILHADHGLNASTFTAMVIASTLSDIYGSVTGGVSALSGPLHGGANQDVMEMLIEIDETDVTPIEWVEQARNNGSRVPGFGHRVYDVKDPRAHIFERRSQELAEVGESKWYDYTSTVETYLSDELGLSERGIAPNVDFYSGSVYYQLGIPTDLYTPIFAMSRAAGWVGHVLEYREDNRLIRPLGKYIGPMSADFVPLDER